MYWCVYFLASGALNWVHLSFSGFSFAFFGGGGGFMCGFGNAAHLNGICAFISSSSRCFLFCQLTLAPIFHTNFKPLHQYMHIAYQCRQRRRRRRRRHYHHPTETKTISVEPVCVCSISPPLCLSCLLSLPFLPDAFFATTQTVWQQLLYYKCVFIPSVGAASFSSPIFSRFTRAPNRIQLYTHIVLMAPHSIHQSASTYTAKLIRMLK